MTADPYAASGGPSDPGSWNRYAYTRGDPVNRTDTSGLQDSGCPPGVNLCFNTPPPIESTGELPGTHQIPGGGDPQCMILYLAGQNNPDAEQMFETYCAGGGTGFAPDPGGGGDPPPAPRPECDRGNETNAKILDFIAANLDAANKLSALTAQLGGGVQIPAGYLLAWAGIESGSGVDPAPVSNGNYFGLTLARGGITSGWIGAVPCGDGAWAGHACFNSADNFYTSGYAALFSHGDRNLDRLQQALTQPGATMASVFNSIASNAPRGSQYNTNPLYGSAIQNYFDTTLAPRLNCP